MPWSLAPLLLLGTVLPAQLPLLHHAVEERLGSTDHWAFTQRALEHDQNRVRERIERYDPSLPPDRRWRLLALDGQSPTDEQQRDWARWKARRLAPRQPPAPLDYLDLDRARLVATDTRHAQWDVPLRSSHRWLFPVESIRVLITIDLATGSLERLNAEVRQPFRVLLGLARITDGVLDLSFPPLANETTGYGPTGSVHVSVTRLGERVEFSWSDFQPAGPPRR